MVCIVLFQRGEPHVQNDDIMKTSKLQQRLQPNRPMMSITLRIPEDVIDDLKRIAPQLGFSGYQPLIRAYIGQGLRHDLARLDDSPIDRFAESLRRHGVEETIITDAMAEVS